MSLVTSLSCLHKGYWPTWHAHSFQFIHSQVLGCCRCCCCVIERGKDADEWASGRRNRRVRVWHPCGPWRRRCKCKKLGQSRPRFVNLYGRASCWKDNCVAALCAALAAKYAACYTFPQQQLQQVFVNDANAAFKYPSNGLGLNGLKCPEPLAKSCMAFVLEVMFFSY